MPDISGALEATSLFAGVIGLLFSMWIKELDDTSKTILPMQYRDRKSYFSDVSNVLLWKALPLSLLMTFYIYGHLSAAVYIWRESSFHIAFSDRPVRFDWSIFALVFSAIIYFFVITIAADIKLIRALRKARRDRKSNEPRIHFFG